VLPAVLLIEGTKDNREKKPKEKHIDRGEKKKEERK
jgi:hypothetical protein